MKRTSYMHTHGNGSIFKLNSWVWVKINTIDFSVKIPTLKGSL